MSGNELRARFDALLGAFPTVAALRRMVRFGLGESLEVIAGGENLSDTVFSLIQWADAQGRTAELLQAALNENPGNAALRRVAEAAGPGGGANAVSPSAARSMTGWESASCSGDTDGATASVTFLHLTDLHFGMKPQDWLWPNVREEFFEDLGRLVGKTGPLDLVLFSGDLAQSGTSEDYAALEAALLKVWSRFRELGSDPVLITVPGNHDVKWPDSRAAAYRALRGWEADEELREYFWSDQDNEYRKLVGAVFQPYSEWRQSTQIPTRRGTAGLLPGDSATTFAKGGLKLGVVGLNSSFLQLGKGVQEGTLDLDPRQLTAVCDGDPVEWCRKHHLNLLMTHHPPEWLSQRARDALRSEINPGGRFAAHFFGHMHEPRSRFTRTGGSPAAREFQGASLFGLETWEGPSGKQVQRIHGYSAGKIELAGSSANLTFWPRVLIQTLSGRRRMGADLSFDLDENDAFTDTLKVRTPA